MKATKLITIIPLVSAVTFGTAFAQGNPHQDPVGASQLASNQGNPHIGFEAPTETVARYQGNPHSGFDAPVETIARYRGNPHEGYVTRVVMVSATAGNPHIGFKLVPLALASSE